MVEPKLSLRIHLPNHRKMSPTTNKKNQKCEIGEDRISSLPDNVIHHILSLLPTGCAVRTLTLSTKWKHLWTGITNLYFSQELTNYNDTKFVDFVHQTMIRRENVAINKFHLSCSVWHLDESLINAWISYALTHNVAHIFLNVGCNVGHDYLVFPCAIFNCESLKLIVGDNCDYSEFEPALVCFSDEITKPSGSISISWSRLRVLQLTHIQFSFDQPINQVHFRLPVLKKLDLIDCFWLNVKIVTFDAPTLESFAFHIIDEFDMIKYPKCNISQVPTLKADVEIKVDAPDLRSLHVVTDLTYKLSLCDLPSLCEASFHIIAYMYESEIELRLSNVFEAISSVTVITLTDFSIYELWSVNLTKKLLSLTHLKFLNVDVIDWCLHGGVLTDLFHYLPCVERLHFNRGLYTDGDFGYPENFGWMLQTLSQPILTKLESVEISCFLGNGNDLGLVKFLLKNARALLKISISMKSEDPKERLEMTNQLEMLSRGLTCSIEIS